MIGNSEIIKSKNKFANKKDLMLIAGPCAVESFDQLYEVANHIKSLGVEYLRAGAFKPRTSPYSFQGLGKEGLEILKKVGTLLDMKTVTEVTSEKNLELVAEYCDIVQIGARNMQNFELLKPVGKIKKPVILKRGMGNTIKEWLLAAEYILSQGNYDVILCERGIKTFETATRNTLDISSVPVVKDLSFLPVIVDPSHACGNKKYVEALALASVAAGANGIMVEVHPNARKAKSDAQQQIGLSEYATLVRKIKAVYSATNTF